MDLDDLPAVASGSQMPPEFPPDAADGMSGEQPPQEETFDHLSPDELLTHPNWKARKFAFEQALSLPEDSKPFIMPHLAKLVKESNAAALESFMELEMALLDIADNAEVTEFFDTTHKVVVEKGLVGRPKTAKLAAQIISLFCLGGEGNRVAEALVAVFKHKTPKNRLAAVTALTTCISEYGVATFPMKIIFKSLVPLFSDTDAKVRKQTMQLCAQCYRFTGPAINNFLTDLRDVQRTELDQLFSTLETGAQPEKEVRGAAPTPKAPQKDNAPAAAGAPAAAASGGIDTYSLMDEASVLSRLPKDFYGVALDKSLKWQDRARVLNDTLLPLLSVPRINANDDYTDLVKTLRDMLLDPQAPISNAANKCIMAITASLRGGLAPYARHLIPAVFEKFREKKASTFETAHQTLAKMVECTVVPFEAFQDEIDAAVGSKIPHHRLNIVNWVVRMVEVVEPSQLTKLCRSSMHARLVTDEKSEVRDTALGLIAKLMALCGETHFKTVLASLDDKQMQKVLKGPSATAASSTTSRRPVSPTPGGAPGLSKTSSTRAPVKTLSSGALKSQGSMSATSTPTAGSTTKAQASEDFESQQMGFDDAVAALGEECSEALELLLNKEWKGRVEGAQMMQIIVERWDDVTLDANVDAVMVVLKTRPGFKESIFQVFNAILTTINTVLTRASGLSQRTAFLLITGISHKLSEAKSKAMVRSILSSCAEFVGPKFVVKHLMALVKELKKPTVTVEALDWIDVTLAEFPQAAVDAKGVVEFLTTYCFEQSSPQIKSNGVKVVVALRRRAGAKLDGFLTNVNPHLKATIDAEVQKGGAGRDVEVRQVRTNAASSKTVTPAATPAASPAVGGSGQYAAPMADEDGDFPRTDVSGQLSGCVKQMTGSSEWKQRLAAVKQVEQIMVAANRNVAPNGISEVLKALKARFEEPNKNLVVDVLKVMQVVAESAGPSGARPGLKFVMPSVLALLGDQKQALRDEANKLAVITFTYLGFESILAALPRALTADSQLARIKIVNLLEPVVDAVDGNSQPNLKHVQAIVPPLLKLCMDRNAEVRAKSEKILISIATFVGVDFINRNATDLKPAEQQQLRGVLEKLYLSNTPAAPVPAPCAPSRSARPQTATGRAPQSNDTSPTPPEARKSTRAPPAAAPMQQQPIPQPVLREELYTIDEIIAGIHSAEPNTAIRMCDDFLFRLENKEDLFEDIRIIEVMMFRLESAFLDERVPQLVHALLSCLVETFRAPVAQRCHTKQLYDYVGIVYGCLLSDFATNDRPAIRGVNDLMRALIENCNADDLFSALMSRLNTYSTEYLKDPTKMHHKFVEITAKCIFRFRVQQLQIDTVIMTSHDCLISHPPSAFKDRDDLTIRTIKTILSDATRAFGEDILDMCVSMIGKQCLVYNFLHVCHTKNLQQMAQQQQQPPSPSAPPQRLSQRHADPYAENKENGMATTKSLSVRQESAPPAAMVAAPPAEEDDRGTSMMGDIFSKMRKHQTADAGFEELYLSLRDEGSAELFEEFNLHYAQCSDAFKAFIQRRVKRHMQSSKETFPLPGCLE